MRKRNTEVLTTIEFLQKRSSKQLKILVMKDKNYRTENNENV